MSVQDQEFAKVKNNSDLTDGPKNTKQEKSRIKRFTYIVIAMFLLTVIYSFIV